MRRVLVQEGLDCIAMAFMAEAIRKSDKIEEQEAHEAWTDRMHMLVKANDM